MPLPEESLKMLVKALIHDVRNQVNGMVLELTDLRERWPEPRVTTETESLMRQTMEIAGRLKDIRERLEPAAPRKQALLLADAWKTIAPQAKPVSGAKIDSEIELDVAQIRQAVAELIVNAVEAGNSTPVPVAEVKEGHLIIRVENTAETAPATLSGFGKLPGYSSKRRHLGLGCSYAASVVAGHGGELTWSYDAAEKKVVAEMKLVLL